MSSTKAECATVISHQVIVERNLMSSKQMLINKFYFSSVIFCPDHVVNACDSLSDNIS